MTFDRTKRFQAPPLHQGKHDGHATSRTQNRGLAAHALGCARKRTGKRAIIPDYEECDEEEHARAVQTIASQTPHNCDDPADFVESFGGRIQSMSRVHSQLSTNEWKCTQVHDIVRDQMKRGPGRRSADFGVRPRSPPRRHDRAADGDDPPRAGDDPLLAMDIAGQLEDAGAQVIGPAGNASAALSLIEQYRFDAALLDANLGGHPVDEIAASLVRKNIPFAFVSGYGRKALPKLFGNASLLSKPFDTDQLIEVAAKLIAEANEDRIDFRAAH